MQISHLNQFTFPKTTIQSLTGNLSEDKAGGTTDIAASATKPDLGDAVRQLTPAQDAPGVILKLQSGSNSANDLVYSDTPKGQVGQGIEAESMAEQHHLAQARHSGPPTRLSVDPSGVLVANAGVGVASKPTEEAKPVDFVSFAVSAMRDYADEQNRLKISAKQDSQASTTSLFASGLGDVQKLAARFKLFT
ncbi:MAG: hypothetical protein IPN53_03320 [Comamonadaceae bacterium]|nr:hypothetical protein [Comamonadaceae bacterium]